MGAKLTEAYVDIVVRMGDLDAKLKAVNAKVQQHVKDIQSKQVASATTTAAKVEQLTTGQHLRSMSAEQRFQDKINAIVADAAAKRTILYQAQAARQAAIDRAARLATQRRTAILGDPRFAQVGVSWVESMRQRMAALNVQTARHDSLLSRIIAKIKAYYAAYIGGKVLQSLSSSATGHYSQFARNLNALGRAVQGVGQAAMVANGPLGRLGLSLGTVMQGVGRLIGNFGMLGSAAGVLATTFFALLGVLSLVHSAFVMLSRVALTMFLASITKVVVKYQSLTYALSAVMGTTKAAQDEIRQLRAVSDLPGLTMDDAIQGSLRLQAIGMSAERARYTLWAFGNALAISGGGAPELEGVVNQLVQIENRSSVSEVQLNRLATHLPQLREMMMQAFGTRTAEGIRNLGVSGQQFVEKLTEQFGQLPPMGDTLKNRWEVAMDSIRRAIIKLLPLMEPIIERITMLLQRIGDTAEGTLGNDAEGLAKWGQQIADALETIVAGVWGFIVGAFGIFGHNIRDWRDAINDFIDALNSAGEWLYRYGYTIGRIFTFVLNLGRSVVVFFKMILQALAIPIAYIAAAFWGLLGLFTGGFSKMKSNFIDVNSWIKTYLIGGINDAAEEWTRLTQAMMAPWEPPVWQKLKHLPPMKPPKPPPPYEPDEITGESNVRWTSIEQIGKDLAVRAAKFSYEEDMLDNSRKQTGYLANIADNTRNLAEQAARPAYNEAW